MSKVSNNSILAIGNFDGVHLGHQRIIHKTKELAESIRFRTGEFINWGVLTFHPHPLVYFQEREKFLITPNGLKEKILKKMDVPVVLSLPFEEICNLSYGEFFSKILQEQLKIRGIVTGNNFYCGKNREGTPAHIKELAAKNNILYHIEDDLIIDTKVCSSSFIRELLKSGNIKESNKLLGRNFQVEGIVIKGKQLARQLGFPTVNMLIDSYAQLKFGVYVVKVEYQGNFYSGIANYGIRPTVDNDNKEMLEVHILNFNQEVYAKLIKVHFIDFVREEKKFNSLEELKQRITLDAQIAKSYFNNLS